MNQPLPDESYANVVELRIPSRAEWVALARLTVATVASRLHFSIDEIEDIKLSVAEACTNAIQHAQDSPFIDIRCETLPEGLRI
ncbi:MAG: ATP-binding protein, partial [Vulcanimicrobiaceae bacterium]